MKPRTEVPGAAAAFRISSQESRAPPSGPRSVRCARGPPFFRVSGRSVSFGETRKGEGVP